MEASPKVQTKTAGSERGTKMLQSIAAYKETVKDNTGGQEPVGFERVPEPVQVARAEMLHSKTSSWECIMMGQLILKRLSASSFGASKRTFPSSSDW